MADERLFDETTRRKLEQLMLVARRVRAGAMKGERRSTKRGTSIEFADYRNYVRGDDLRRLDWNIYGRLERPFIKLLEDEEDLAVHLILDVSASMDWPQEGERDRNKFLYARRLFAGLAYMALATNDRLALLATSDTAVQPFGPVRGRGFGLPMLAYVGGLKAAGITDLNAALKDYALRAGRPGLCFIISDLLMPGGYQDGINRLLSRGYEVGLIHVLSPDEIEPPLGGDLRLVDVETGQAQEVTIDAGMRDLYIKRLEAWREGIRADCVRRGVHYVGVDTGVPWEKVILFNLRRLGAVK
ncbi:MAG: hypothetical protein BroJett038_00690 [Chloroflexota bacterium]|jgi:uncharacterized protein (DUF58 family)|nr:MAG: hypothetical protein BroJett038_00690 [Chloroflexota bacterium]